MEEKLHLSSQYIRQTSFLLSYLMTEGAQKWDLASVQEEHELIDWQTKHSLCCSCPDGLQRTPYSFLMGYHCFLPKGQKIVTGCISDSTVILQMHSLYPWKPTVSLCPPQVQYMEEKNKWVANLLLLKRINGRYILILVLRQFQDFTDHYKRSPINLIVRYDWCQFWILCSCPFFSLNCFPQSPLYSLYK